MNLFELFVKIGVDDQASDKISNLSSKLGNGLKTAANIGIAAVGAASTAIVSLGKIGLEYNSQMEQYTTNFTTMLGSQEAAVQKVQELKEFAASTPLSMDDLAKGTQTLLAFGVESENSTEILQQLGDIALGDADKMQRLSNAFGKATASGKLTGEIVQQMIDAGWNPLIQISEAAGETMEETQARMSAGAVSVEELQAAMEAVTSGTGQFAGGMEAASHTTQGLISTLKDNARALVGEVFMPISNGILENVLPGAINAVSALSEAFKENGINGMIAAAGEMLGSLINSIVEYAPGLVDTAVMLVNSLIQGLSNNQESIATGAVQIITSLATGILNMLPQIVALGLDLIVSLANGIAESIPELSPVVIDVMLQIVNTLTNPDTLSNLVDAALAIILALSSGLIEAIPRLLESIPIIIGNLVQAIIDSVPQIIFAAGELVFGLIEGLTSPNNTEALLNGTIEMLGSIIIGIASYYKQMFEKGGEIFTNIKEGFMQFINDPIQWGKDLIDNFISGITQKWENLKNTVSNVAQSVKDFLGFSEPKKGPLSNFHTYAPDMMDLFIKGIRDNEKKLTDQIEKTFDFGERTITAGISYSSYSDEWNSAGRNYGAGRVSVVQNIYSEAKTAADLMQEALYQQERAVLLGV